MALALFAGIPVTDYPAALQWYERLFGTPPTFVVHETEAVWEVADSRSFYVVLNPEKAGHAIHTLFLDDFDEVVARIEERGLEPVERETYSNGVRKTTFRDPDGNEIGFGGGPS
ncbi:VOC family protein [Allokutzneria sp. NRRL B-24872]|uniref:VOC family protein n=1 Tax=Allokutzneria sp. NRRL B-24872 TaxID=1137961 RepID=UPI000A38F72C|nr:VOC family protein [Allokutzneria sp. NRRL B-24872]